MTVGVPYGVVALPANAGDNSQVILGGSLTDFDIFSSSVGLGDTIKFITRSAGSLPRGIWGVVKAFFDPTGDYPGSIPHITGGIPQDGNYYVSLTSGIVGGNTFIAGDICNWPVGDFCTPPIQITPEQGMTVLNEADGNYYICNVPDWYLMASTNQGPGGIPGLGIWGVVGAWDGTFSLPGQRPGHSSEGYVDFTNNTSYPLAFCHLTVLLNQSSSFLNADAEGNITLSLAGYSDFVQDVANPLKFPQNANFQKFWTVTWHGVPSDLIQTAMSMTVDATWQFRDLTGKILPPIQMRINNDTGYLEYAAWPGITMSVKQDQYGDYVIGVTDQMGNAYTLWPETANDTLYIEAVGAASASLRMTKAGKYTAVFMTWYGTDANGSYTSMGFPTFTSVDNNGLRVRGYTMQFTMNPIQGSVPLQVAFTQQWSKLP